MCITLDEVFNEIVLVPEEEKRSIETVQALGRAWSFERGDKGSLSKRISKGFWRGGKTSFTARVKPSSWKLINDLKSPIKEERLLAFLECYDKRTAPMNRVGKGAFGEVFYTAFEEEEFAIKLLGKGKLSRIEREQRLSVSTPFHKNLVGARYSGSLWGIPCIVMDFHKGDNLQNPKLRQQFILSVRQEKIREQRLEMLKTCMRLILEGVAHLHSYSLVHRDLKPANILWNEGEAKIIDWGFVRKLNQEALSKEGLKKEYRASHVGTTCYMAPEVMLDKPYGLGVDIWSLGVAFYLLALGKKPFTGKNKQEVRQKIKGAKVHYPDFLPKELKIVLRSMLQKNPKDRPSAKQLLEDPFFSLVGVSKKNETSLFD